MKLLRSKKEIINKEEYFKEYWELNNKMELIVIKYNSEDQWDIGVRFLEKEITQEIFDQLIKVEEYKNVLNLITVLFDTKWIVIPKNLCSSIMEYIENNIVL